MPRKTNFTANGNSYYRVTATVGKKPDGSPLRKQFYGESKKDAENKRDEYLAGLKQGLSVGYDKATFRQAFEHWLECVQRPAIGLSTYAKYESYSRLHIIPCGLSAMRLIDIRAANIQGVYNALLETTTAKNVHQIHKILKVFFSYCLKADILVKNPLLAVELPKVAAEQSDTNTALSDDDIEMLVHAAKKDIKYFPYVFACFTGLRAGELLALTYRDIDFSAGMVSVNKSVKYLTVDGDYQPVLSETKTPSSIRRVPVLDAIQELLREHIETVRKNTSVFTVDGDFLLFPSTAGTYKDGNNFREAYQRLCNKLDIKKGRTIHSLRHTFCTILARQGVSLLDASRLMGHSNIQVTAKVYAHVTENDKKNAVKKLSAYFA
jgi:integrase